MEGWREEKGMLRRNSQLDNVDRLSQQYRLGEKNRRREEKRSSLPIQKFTPPRKKKDTKITLSKFHHFHTSTSRDRQPNNTQYPTPRLHVVPCLFNPEGLLTALLPGTIFSAYHPPPSSAWPENTYSGRGIWSVAGRRRIRGGARWRYPSGCCCTEDGWCMYGRFIGRMLTVYRKNVGGFGGQRDDEDKKIIRKNGEIA